MEGELIRTNSWLAPLAWIYGMVTFLRNCLFDWGVLKSKKYPIPVISVGNITVGGTGKTPHIEYLIRMLSGEYKVAVLSRGYKRKSRGYVLATEDTPLEEIGDESWQIKQKFPDIYVAVDADRCHGIERLMADESTKDVQIILLDDAFQHRYVTPGRNILLTDFHRLITRDKILPEGRLRESPNGKERANMVIVTKCPKDLLPMQYRIIAETLHLRPYQQLYFSTFKYGRMLNLYDMEVRSMKQLSNYNVLLFTGIGCPKQMRIDLEGKFASITNMDFGDHHYYTKSDLLRVKEELEKLPEPRLVITTEKDATKLMSMDSLPVSVARHIWVLPIGVKILLDKDIVFKEKITDYVRKNLRNS